MNTRETYITPLLDNATNLQSLLHSFMKRVNGTLEIDYKALERINKRIEKASHDILEIELELMRQSSVPHE